MAHNHPLLVWDLETSGIYISYIASTRDVVVYKPSPLGCYAPLGVGLINQQHPSWRWYN